MKASTKKPRIYVCTLYCNNLVLGFLGLRKMRIRQKNF